MFVRRFCRISELGTIMGQFGPFWFGRFIADTRPYSGRKCWHFTLDFKANEKAKFTKLISFRWPLWSTIRNKVRYALVHIRPGWIYYEVRGMDCDCATFNYSGKVWGGWRYHKVRDQEIYEYAEGPTSVWRISKSEYKNFEAERSRDLALEAYEDGHSHVVYY